MKYLPDTPESEKRAFDYQIDTEKILAFVELVRKFDYTGYESEVYYSLRNIENLIKNPLVSKLIQIIPKCKDVEFDKDLDFGYDEIQPYNEYCEIHIDMKSFLDPEEAERIIYYLLGQLCKIKEG